MAEDEAMFDPTMKKKKKKKKVPLDLDALEEPSTPSNMDENTHEMENQENTVEEKEEKEDKDILDLDDFSGMKKKKKKKKKPYDMEGLEDALPDSASENKTEETGGNDGEKENNAETKDDLDFSFSTKKKKKKKKPVLDETDMNEVESKGIENGADSDADDDMLDDNDDNVPAWNDRDYTYEELLTRVFDIMRAKNPEMVTGEKKKFVMKPPQVVRIGTKKTSFANFTDICKILHRQPKHLLAFLLAELGTSGSIDGNNQLIIKGRFQQKMIENVLRRYIKEYVTCNTCRSPDTILQKETRLFFIQCETCGSRRSVASIKSGFQAITQKRAQLKSKQQ
ncbi:eukaryotic translation initiation factor 2 subunit 2 isoform X2 [Pocillopora verrucosa]|uniref:eukaryotic translation initiation factor 2 subunit 2 isoform X2 n=1 Tax=Pocillopora verrucosa TaxID=203993 RepID=UPI002796EBCD|nr:eukaryotic translation initiation factor 2 subunit 2-like isoform X2 [Pocillopora verrucosa]